MSNQCKKDVPLYWETIFNGVLETPPMVTQPYVEVSLDELLEEAAREEEDVIFFWPSHQKTKTETQKIEMDELRRKHPNLFK